MAGLKQVKSLKFMFFKAHGNPRVLLSRAHGRKRGARTPKEEVGEAGGEEGVAEATGEFVILFFLDY